MKAGVHVFLGASAGNPEDPAHREVEDQFESGVNRSPPRHGAQVVESVFVRFTVLFVFPHGPAANGSR